MSNVLDLLDQTMFDYAQASGSTTRLQCVWVYNRPVDIDGLRQFHAHLERGRLSRCIAHSPLPFGRSRWVAPDNSAELEIAVAARPREAFDGWLDEQSNSPLDCEHGPAWHLALLPFTDGGAGVSLTIDHCLIDGVGLWEAVADAALGRDDPIDWPDAASRGRWQALREDARQTVSDIPAMSRAVIAAMKLGRSSRNGATAAAPPATDTPPPPSETDESHNLPTATIFVNADEWDARARSLGGTSNTLLVGLATRLAQRAGRVATDGSVVVTLPVNERTPDDTRANAISGVLATVNTESATTDLREIRAAVKQALIRHRGRTRSRAGAECSGSPVVQAAAQSSPRRDQGERVQPRRCIQRRCDRCGRKPARWHRGRLLCHPTPPPRRRHTGDAAVRRIADFAIGNSAGKGFRFADFLPPGPHQLER